MRTLSVSAAFLGLACCASCVSDGPYTCEANDEVCNGLDDDCDGVVDEAPSGGPLRRQCASACGAGREECEAGAWRYCDAPPPSAEQCDGADNDCDGQADEGCECRHGERRSCGVEVGVCGVGVEHCSFGEWGECLLPYDPDDLAEVCNDGLDNDCDGETDEACLCLPGEAQQCGFEEGECVPGVMTCRDDATWDPRCTGAVGPAADVCDGLDNDCDGAVDRVVSVDFGWALDAEEPNDTCLDAAPLYGDAGVAEIHEGDHWVSIAVADSRDIESYPTLYRGEDRDWYEFRAVEASDWCVPWTSECSYVVHAQLWLMDADLVEGAVERPEDFRLCIATASCAEVTDTSAMTCTHLSDWDAASSSYLFAISWGGSCAGDDSRDVKMLVESPTGAACGHYQLYVRFAFDDTLACP